MTAANNPAPKRKRRAPAAPVNPFTQFEDEKFPGLYSLENMPADPELFKVNYLVEPLIPRGSLSIFYGKKNSAKSTLIANIVAYYATQNEALELDGLTKEAPGLAVIFSPEGVGSLFKRLRMGFGQGWGEKVWRGASRRIKVINTNRIAGYDLTNAEAAGKTLRAYVERCEELAGEHCALIVLETLGGQTQGKLNDAAEMVPLLNMLNEQFCNQGRSVIVIHHTNKTNTMHGSVFSANLAETVFRCDHVGGDDFKVTCENIRDGVRGWGFHYSVSEALEGFERQGFIYVRGFERFEPNKRVDKANSKDDIAQTIAEEIAEQGGEIDEKEEFREIGIRAGIPESYFKAHAVWGEKKFGPALAKAGLKRHKGKVLYSDPDTDE